MTMADVDSTLTRIHDVIQNSGLHFKLTQTPWSSYIIIRRKFTNTRYTVNSNLNVNEAMTSDELKSMNVKNQQMEQRLAQIEVEKVELEEEFKVLEQNYSKTVDHLHAQICTLENKLDEEADSLKKATSEILIPEEEKATKNETRLISIVSKPI